MELLTLENFLWLQAAIVIIGITYIMRRGAQPGARFRWDRRAGGEGGRTLPAEMARSRGMWEVEAPLSRRPESPRTGRSLNVHFNYNGHSWDAYEALGLPAGAALEKAEQAYAEALTRSSQNSKEFYDHALDAIRRHLKSN